MNEQNRFLFGEESVYFEYYFTETELKEKAKIIAQCRESIDDLEGEKKSNAAMYKEKIDEETAIQRKEAFLYRSGKERRNSMCYKVADYTKGEMHFIDKETGEYLKKRPLEKDELQIPLIAEVFDDTVITFSTNGKNFDTSIQNLKSVAEQQ